MTADSRFPILPTMQNQTFTSTLSIQIAATALSVIFTNYLASVLGGIIGIFKVRMEKAGDVRGHILRAFPERRHARGAMTEASSPVETRSHSTNARGKLNANHHA